MPHSDNFEKRNGITRHALRTAKLSNKIKTVEDLFIRSDVKQILEDLLHSKRDITDVIVLYKTSSGEIRVAQSGITDETMCQFLLRGKDILLNLDE